MVALAMAMGASTMAEEVKSELQVFV